MKFTMRNCRKCKIASLCDKCLIIVFRAWAKFVSSHPIITIILSTIFAGSTIYFVFDLETEDSLEELYVPKNTESWNNKEKYRSTWGRYDNDDYRWNNIIFTKHNKNVYTMDNLLELFTIHQLITNNMTFTYQDQTYNYADICYKQDNKCYTRCILEFYNFNASTIRNTFSLDQSKNFLTYPFDYSKYHDELVLMTEFIGQTPQSIPIQNNNNNNTIFANNSILISTPAFSCEYNTDDSGTFSYDLLVEWE
eukprot:142259_1